MSEWQSVESPPVHGQKVKTKDIKGREFECTYFHWSKELKPYFKLNGSVFNHDKVIEWMPM